MRLILRLLILVAIGIVATGCGKGTLAYRSEDASSGSSGTTPVTSTQALAILQTNCAACHGAPTGGDGGVSNILDVNTLIFSGLLVPGSADTSPMLQEIEVGAMPPSPASPLSADDITTLRDWVQEGMIVAPSPTPVPSPPPPTTTTASFKSLTATIFQPKCLSCHSGAGAASGVRLDSYAEVLKHVNLKAPTSSEIYSDTLSGKMPEAGTRLSTAELTAMLQWIQNGALNN